jgi:hypothetical protein
MKTQLPLLLGAFLILLLLLLHLSHSTFCSLGSKRSQLGANPLVSSAPSLLQRLAHRTTVYQLGELSLDCFFLVTADVDTSRMIRTGWSVSFFAESLYVLI